MSIRYPDFICIGAQKCGTTWLYDNLSNQIGVGLPSVKELQYFNEIWLPYQRDWTKDHRRKQVLDHLEWYFGTLPRTQWDLSYIGEVIKISEWPICDHWYGAIFGHLSKQAVVGEFTPEYALLPLMGFQHILRLNNNVKFIFLVRDPIERAWSQMKMIVQNEKREPSINTYREILQYDDIRIRSDYFQTIHTIRQSGAGGALYVNSIDAIIARPCHLLQEICEFIDAPRDRLDFSRTDKVIHSGTPGEIPPELLPLMWEQLASCYNRFEDFAPDLVRTWRERSRL
jgi:hypothetical protein